MMLPVVPDSLHHFFLVGTKLTPELGEKRRERERERERKRESEREIVSKLNPPNCNGPLR